jgi:hypothetical protein
LARSTFNGRSSSHVDSNSESCYTSSLRQVVFGLLQKDPLLTARDMCRELSLPYGKYGAYVNNCKSFWKSNCRNERGSKCSIHACRGWCYAPDGVDRARALGVGWIPSRARNRWLLWKDRLGRLQWFETGRVNLYVRKPANLGKAKQLVCNGFSFTGLITDLKVLERILKGIRFKGAHYVFETGHRMPKLVIDQFTKSNGVSVEVGDASHPNAVEIVTCYPDWAERNERMLEEIRDLLRNGFYEKDYLYKPDYVT